MTPVDSNTARNSQDSSAHASPAEKLVSHTTKEKKKSVSTSFRFLLLAAALTNSSPNYYVHTTTLLDLISPAGVISPLRNNWTLTGTGSSSHILLPPALRQHPDNYVITLAILFFLFFFIILFCYACAKMPWAVYLHLSGSLSTRF